jgi:hypothetical protein
MSRDDRHAYAEWCFDEAARCAEVGADRLADWWRRRALELAFGDDA